MEEVYCFKFKFSFNNFIFIKCLDFLCLLGFQALLCYNGKAEIIKGIIIMKLLDQIITIENNITDIFLEKSIAGVSF